MAVPAPVEKAPRPPSNSRPSDPLDFSKREHLIEAAVDLVEAIHFAIDWESFGAGRRMGYWSELEAKVNAYAKRSLTHFLWRLGSAFNARAPEGPRLLTILESPAAKDILDIARNSTTLVVLKLRARIQARKEKHTK